MKKPFLPFFAALLLVTTVSSFFAAGTNEKGKADQGALKPVAPHWTVTVPAQAFPGDCVVIAFSSTVPLSGAAVTLNSPAGKTVARVHSFDVNGTGTPEAGMPALPAPTEIPGGAGTRRYTQVALLGLSTFLKPGSYLISADAVLAWKPVRYTSPLDIAAKSFIFEVIPLDEKNTLIKTDDSVERARQIRRLNAILFGEDQAAPRFYGPWQAPLESTRRTAFFGDRRVYQYADGKKESDVHYGIDFGVPVGTPVFAAGDGLVVMAERRISSGWTIVIEHLPGVFSLYYHLDALLAAENDHVRAGTLIGRSGMTGLATGPHLHLEFRVNGEAVSPDWFAGRTIH